MNAPAGLRRTAVVRSPDGLHARPAARIARIAREARGSVGIAVAGQHVDADSVLDLLTLGCAEGVRMTISVEDPADRPVMDAIAELVERGFKD